MKRKTLGLIRGIGTNMVVALLGTIAACAYTTYSLEAKRKLPSDHGQLDMMIQGSQTMISEYMSSPVLPSLESSWREVSALARLYGLALTPELESPSGDISSGYEGPLNSWRGYIDGDPALVFAVAKRAQQQNPIFLLDYSVRDGKAQLYIAVVGI
tara:strand:- start:78755 stop:79222 length:468 start_codon:yes stop_codon:yes gene_type:complete